jgi:DNA polymerase-3 subunit beta
MQADTVAKKQIKFSIGCGTLLSVLQQVVGVVERRQTLPILGNVLLEVSQDQLQIVGTDLEVELSASVALLRCEYTGEITVPARKLMDICRNLSDQCQLTLSFEKQTLVIKADNSRFSLSCLPAAEFPRAPQLKEPSHFTVSSLELITWFSVSHFAMAQQDVRYFLNGSLLEIEGNSITVVATDGHRLALSQQKIATDHSVAKKVIIPRKAVLEMIKLFSGERRELKISFDNNHICIISDGLIMTSKLVDGRFPDYNRVIPRHNDKLLTIDRDTLKKALTRVSILANEKHRGVRIELSDGNMTLSASNPEREHAEESLSVDYRSDPINIGFNVSYLLDILSVLPEGNLTWQFSNSSGSVLVNHESASQSLAYVVMPMRL